ncbi:MAG: Blue-light-activated protein [Lentisphaerae bacterium ADurb.BinA184]|nr:MAG: Blue-light-activated protein [Lentisphaerae bacterium ADurb.BinA184]
MPRSLAHSLILKIGAVMLVIEVIAFTITGAYFVRRFSEQVDQRVAERMRIPGMLISQRLLSYESVTDAATMRKLVGDDLVEGMVVGANGIVFQALNPAHVGRRVTEVPGVRQEWFAPGAPSFWLVREGNVSQTDYVTLAPIYAVEGRAPFLYTLLRVQTTQAEREKRDMVRLFAAGLIITVAATSLAILIIFRLMIVARLDRLGRVFRQVESGDLSARAQGHGGRDEIGALFPAFNRMAARLDGTMAEMVAEVAERKRAEDALRESEENLQITLNSIGDAVIATDRDGRITRMNPVAEALTGWSVGAARGMALSEVFRVVDAETRRPVEDPVARILAAGERLNLSGQRILLARDGWERRVADSGAPIRDRQGRALGTVLVFRDVTDEFALQEQLRQSQKMEAIGQLAGGVAHDFNNLLGAILGYAELIRLTAADNPECLRSADGILHTARSAARLTDQLLAFARKAKLQSVPVDVHQVIDDIVEILSHTIDPRIRIHRQLDPAPVSTLGDPVQLQNALLNLALNARDAMPDGGDLTFGTRRLMLDAGQCRSHAFRLFDLRPGPFVEISVVDTGVGIDHVTLSHMFEPFFTTKPKGKGTGMGLAAVYGTVKSHHGAVTFSSAQGRGTRFRVLLPVSEVPSPPSPAAGERADGPARRGQILVVDDNLDILLVVSELLKGLGYQVRTATCGHAAVECMRQHGGRIDLVILDMIMPDMNGRDVFRQLRVLRPELAVLVCTGYSTGDDVQDVLNEGARGVLQKPFQRNELAAKVELAMAAPPQTAAFVPDAT